MKLKILMFFVSMSTCHWILSVATNYETTSYGMKTNSVYKYIFHLKIFHNTRVHLRKLNKKVNKNISKNNICFLCVGPFIKFVFFVSNVTHVAWFIIIVNLAHSLRDGHTQHMKINVFTIPLDNDFFVYL